MLVKRYKEWTRNIYSNGLPRVNGKPSYVR